MSRKRTYDEMSNENPSVSTGIVAGIVAGIGAGIGAEIGAEINMIKLKDLEHVELVISSLETHFINNTTYVTYYTFLDFILPKFYKIREKIKNDFPN
jgi:hypothetical protein